MKCLLSGSSEKECTSRFSQVVGKHDSSQIVHSPFSRWLPARVVLSNPRSLSGPCPWPLCLSPAKENCPGVRSLQLPFWHPARGNNISKGLTSSLNLPRSSHYCYINRQILPANPCAWPIHTALEGGSVHWAHLGILSLGIWNQVPQANTDGNTNTANQPMEEVTFTHFIRKEPEINFPLGWIYEARFRKGKDS